MVGTQLPVRILLLGAYCLVRSLYRVCTSVQRSSGVKDCHSQSALSTHFVTNVSFHSPAELLTYCNCW